MRMFRRYLIILIARLLRVPIRIGDEYWVNSYENEANRVQSSERSR
jgi:hypothetical protein